MNNRYTSKTLHLHIGLPKTASSWLQSNVFPQLDHLLYLNCPKSTLFFRKNSSSQRTRFLGRVFKSSSQIWAGFGNEIFEELLGEQKAWLEDNRDVLISEEMIGRRGSRPALLSAHLSEMKNIALQWGFERINIICLIRRQDNWLASHYAQVSKDNPSAGQADFERLIHHITSKRHTRFQMGVLLDYNILYNFLNDVSLSDSLLMMPYEKLKHDPDQFLQVLLGSLGTPPDKITYICKHSVGTKANVRSEKGIWQLRHQRKHIGRVPIPNWVLGRKKKTINLTPEIKRQIHQTFSLSNRNLSDKSGMKLDQYGYIEFG